MNKAVIDTNILIYGIDENSKFYQRSRTVLENTDKQLFTTSKNISEFLTVITREPPRGYGLETSVAMKVFDRIIESIAILFPNEHSFAMFKTLLNRYEPTGLKVYDLEVASIALANEIYEIATLNSKDFDHIQEIDLIEV